MQRTTNDSSLILPRRRVIQTGLLAAAGAAVGAVWTPAANAQTNAAATDAKQRVARLAHLTDVHVQPEHAGDRGFIQCLHHMQKNANPDLVLFGGDAVINVNDSKPARTQQLFDLYRRVLKDELSTPYFSAIGNHDVPDTKGVIASKASDDSAKAWACDLFGLNKRYFSFDSFGWHFIVLDSVRVGGAHGYSGKLDEEQYAWLEADLAKAVASKTPVLVLSHIPIITVTGFFDGERLKSGDWDVPRSFMHVDAVRLHELFVKSGNVKLCISGHEHQLDRCDFDGITYGCNGAVCGNWWKGTYKHTLAGYATIDLFNDGTFDMKYSDYGWTAVD